MNDKNINNNNPILNNNTLDSPSNNLLTSDNVNVRVDVDL
jgi:hypothetical protein